ncbi:hypothetical protein K3495_g10097 [Podosphaera aphanis]|nr:hypothetical protein K3495_g10097 [Podosphaera aphanis]
MVELRRYRASQMVQQAANMRNGPSANRKGLWTGPWNLVEKNRENITVNINGKNCTFRSTSVRKWFDKNDDPNNLCQREEEKSEHQRSIQKTSNIAPEVQRSEQTPSLPQESHIHVPLLRRSQREGRFKGRHQFNYKENFGAIIESGMSQVFLSPEEQEALELSIQLREKGLIITPGEPFEASTKQEIEGLMESGVFKFKHYDESMIGKRIFNSRMVNTIKGKTTLAPFEKSRLVVQAFKDKDKHMILTQSPTVQRASIRLILALSIPFIRKFNHVVFLRDISQAYTLSKTSLTREILCRPAPEIVRALNLEPEIIMQILKPLYGIPEAGNHWFGTYFKHLKEMLNMKPSCFDPCLLTTTSESHFGITGMQVDDTLFLGTENFVQLEDKKLKEAKFKAKDISRLTESGPLLFNGLMITLKDGTLHIQPNGQGDKINPIDPGDSARFIKYKKMRALGAWISSSCQPLVAFRLSQAAQHQEPEDNEIEGLNIALNIQKSNPDAGLKYVNLNLDKGLALYAWVDGSLANKDLTSQIGYVIALGNEARESNSFKFSGNLIHWSSTKCKRVSRSVIASELYAMIQGIDIAIPLCTTLNQIVTQLGLPRVPLIICTDSFSLYECLVKLGITKENRLMIDIMAIRESYERRELTEIRWINGKDNPADAMTKEKPTTALQQLVETNKLKFRLQGWVDRKI